jgi:putative ubiquitin-RnfH superfamily antitoxin RatB of RatAB toxin-antitoxin module
VLTRSGRRDAGHNDLHNRNIGIFGKLTRLDAVLEQGAGVEIYRPVVADPETAERRDRD